MATHAQTVSSAEADAAVKRLVRAIVEAVDPLRIILFGSQARGTARPASDVDLLVVMPEGHRPLSVAKQIYREVSCNGVAFDVLVATPDQLEKHRDNPGLIYRTVLQEGRDVYERSGHA